MANFQDGPDWAWMLFTSSINDPHLYADDDPACPRDGADLQTPAGKANSEALKSLLERAGFKVWYCDQFYEQGWELCVNFGDVGVNLHLFHLEDDRPWNGVASICGHWLRRLFKPKQEIAKFQRRMQQIVDLMQADGRWTNVRLVSRAEAGI